MTTIAPNPNCFESYSAGCGIQIVSCTISVKNSDLAGSGLGTEGTCGLKVNTGCGLDIVSDAVIVKTSDLAGDGLEPAGGSGSCALQVKTGCGLEKSAGAVRVKNSDLAGDGLAPVGTCSLKVNTNVTVRSVTSVDLEITGSNTLRVTINYDEYDVYGVAGDSGSTYAEVDVAPC